MKIGSSVMFKFSTGVINMGEALSIYGSKNKDGNSDRCSSAGGPNCSSRNIYNIRNSCQGCN